MAKGKKAVRREAKVGQVFQDADSRMNGRKLTVVSVKKQHKNEGASGRFKAGHYYATCKTKSGLLVKVDEARLFSSAYRLIPDVAAPIVEPFDPVKHKGAKPWEEPIIAREVCESVENCGCAPTASEPQAEIPVVNDEPVSPA